MQYRVLPQELQFCEWHDTKLFLRWEQPENWAKLLKAGWKSANEEANKHLPFTSFRSGAGSQTHRDIKAISKVGAKQCLHTSTSYCYRTRIRGKFVFFMLSLSPPYIFRTCLFKVFHFQLHGVVGIRTPLLFVNNIQVIDLFRFFLICVVYIYHLLE